MMILFGRLIRVPKVRRGLYVRVGPEPPDSNGVMM
jgi:hypothetical protein